MSYNYDYNYGQTVGTGAGVLAGVSVIPIAIISLCMTVILIIALWKIFEKCGEEGWKSIVPIYNIITLFKIVGIAPWYIALALIPCVGPIIFTVFSIIAYIRLAKKFGKDSTGFILLIIFLAPIALLILAFDKNCVVVDNALVAGQQVPNQNVNANPAAPVMEQQNMDQNNNNNIG